MKKKEYLTKSELRVMKVVWDVGEGVTGPEILRRINKSGEVMSNQTMYVFLHNLIDKGFLQETSEGRGNKIYEAIKPEISYRRLLLQDYIDFWYKGDSRDLIIECLDMLNLDSKEFERVSQYIENINI